MPTRLPVQYIGDSTVQLRPRPGDPYRDANGTPLTSLLLSQGDTLLLDEAEALGQTYLIATNADMHAYLLGTGYCPLPQHRAESWQALQDRRFAYAGDQRIPPGTYYYQFHTGRSDFVPLVPHARAIGTAPLVVVANGVADPASAPRAADAGRALVVVPDTLEAEPPVATDPPVTDF